MAVNQKAPEFAYVAQDRTTRSVIEGKITAPDAASVEEALLRRGLIPVAVTKVGGSGLSAEISLARFGIGGRIKMKDIAIWSRQFSIMVDSGLPVVKALNILALQTEKKPLAEVTADIRSEIEGGNSLGEAMEKHVDVFGDLIVNMVRAGELGGFLDKTLLQIAKDLEGDVKLRAKVKSAMTYPVVVMVMAVVMSAGMLIFIVPVFAKMFAEMGGTLPLPTRIMVSLSAFLKVGAIPMIVVGFLGSVWWRKNKRNMKIREFLDPKKLKMPVFGKLVTKIAISRFARNFGTLLGSGVPILKALDIVSGTVGNQVIVHALDDVRREVSQGNPMSEPLSKHTVFPPMVVQMISVGEVSGNVEFMLAKVAEDYDQQVETMTEQLASLIEPIMIVVMGAMVGAMVISLYLPIFSIYDLVGK